MVVVRGRSAGGGKGMSLDPMAAKVAVVMARHNMVDPGDRVLVGVSGGVDSVTLLDLLAALAPRWNLTLHVCYVHHGLRAAADDEARFVAALAARYGLPFSLEKIHVPQGPTPGTSRQAVARDMRYRALEEVAARSGARRLAVAHHRDDHLETVLMRFLTGTGPDGLAGIPPVRGRLIRPLIATPLAEIEDYARRRGLTYRFDESNLDRRYLRNRVRLDLIPYLEREYNPNLREALDRLSRIAADEAAWVEGLAAAAEAKVVGDHPLYAAVPFTALAVQPLAALAVPLQRRILRRALWRIGAPRADFTTVEAVRALLTGEAGAAADLPAMVRARRHGGQLYLYHRSLATPVPYGYELPLPGSCFVAPVGVHLAVYRSGDPPPPVPAAPPAETPPGANMWQAPLPLDDGTGSLTLTVRPPRPHDRLLVEVGAPAPAAPSSGAGSRPRGPVTRRLRDMLRALGVPVPLRPWLPVVCHGPYVVAVPGYYPRVGAAPQGRPLVVAWPSDGKNVMLE